VRRGAGRGLVALVAVALLAGACAAAPDCERIAGVRTGVCPLPVEARRPVPDLALPVIAAEGVDAPAELSLADLRGRVVIVNFWASWCGPCRLEQPDLNAAADLLPPDEVVIVGVNIEDTEANALAHLREFAVPYPSLSDPVNDLAGRFEGIGARTIPTTLVLDRSGRVAARVLGLTTLGEVAGLADVVASEAP
jgi:thiol-disulfide isomerase/thioredoxin